MSGGATGKRAAGDPVPRIPPKTAKLPDLADIRCIAPPTAYRHTPQTKGDHKLANCYLPLLGWPRVTVFAFVSVSVTLRTLFTPEIRLARALIGGMGFSSKEARVMNPITASTTRVAVLFLMPVTNSSTYLIVVTCFSLCQSALEGLVRPFPCCVFGSRSL